MYVSDYDDIFEIWTPSVQMDLADAIKGDVDRLDVDILASSTVTAAFQSSWGTFKKSWDDFYDSLTGASGYLKRLATGGPYRQMRDYWQPTLVSWQNKFKALGGSIVGPGVTPRPKQMTLADVLGGLKGVLIAGGVVYGLVLFGPALSGLVGGRRKRRQGR